jgi:hypothetical protein
MTTRGERDKSVRPGSGPRLASEPRAHRSELLLRPTEVPPPRSPMRAADRGHRGLTRGAAESAESEEGGQATPGLGRVSNVRHKRDQSGLQVNQASSNGAL